MKQKTKHLQSSGETRKTNRPWHFLSTLNSLLLSKLLLLLIIPAIGSTAAWGDPTLATKDYGTTSHKYLDVANSTSNAQIKNGANCVAFGQVYLTSIKNSAAWYETSAGTSSTSSSYSNQTDDGFLEEASNSTVDFNKGYGYFKVTNTAPVYFWVTGTTSIAAYGRGNSNTITLHIDEVGADGTTLTAVGTDVSVTDNTVAPMIHTSALNASKYYKVTVIESGSDYGRLFQIRFAQPSAKYTVSFNAGAHGTYTGGDITEESAGAGITLPALTTLEDGYVFNGWFTADTGGDKVGDAGATYKPSADTPLYAQYVAKTTNNIHVTPSSENLYIGKTLNISSYVLSSSDGAITYSSSDESVATVNSSGVITPKKAGSATITVNQAEGTTYLSGSTSFTVTVLAAPDQYTVNLAVNNASYGSVSAVYGTGGDPYNDKAAGATLASGSSVSNGTKITVTATPNPGYEFDPYANPAGNDKYNPWGTATTNQNNPLTNYNVSKTQTLTAHFKAKTYAITLDKNGGSTDGSATATYNSGTLTGYSAATHATKTLTGYWTAESNGTKVINDDGTLVANVSGYTDGSGNWIKTNEVSPTLYAQWEEDAATLYTVTFNGDGFGTPASSSLTETSEGGGVSLPSCTPSHSDYIFQGWATTSHASSADAGAASATYNPSDNVTLYAVYTFKVYVPEPTNGSVVAKYTNSGGDDFVSGTAVTYDTTLYFSATPSTGYQFTGWGSATGSTDNPLTMDIQDHKTFTATFTAKTYSINIDKNSGSASAHGSASATYNSNKLTGITAPTYAGKVVEGYYKEAGCTTKIADASGNLQANTTYTDASGNWTNDGAVTLYAKWEDAPAGVTTLPVTYDFTTSPWSTSTDLSGASVSSGLTILDTSNNHNIHFRGSSTSSFSIKNESGQHLQFASNASTSNYIAIPMTGINGRIDIDVWAPYASTSDFSIKAVLITGSTAYTNPNGINNATLDVNKYVDGHFNFRMTDITATEGVLYIGRKDAGSKNIEKIRISTPAHYLIPDKESLTMGDASDPETVTITNYSSYPVLLKTVPSCVTATFEPSTGVLVVTPKSVGTGNIEFAVDTDGNGIATSTDLSIPVTVTGITIGTQPVSKVYKDGGDITALSVSATNSGAGSLTYQWYKNTVNSTTGGEKVGSNSASYTPSLTAEANAFYYCEVSADGAQTKTSDVAYVLYSNSKRYFQMSNVAGNKETSTNDEKITGQVIAGGHAYVQTDANYRYITRPATSNPHMYVAKNTGKYFKIELANAIATGDQISVRLLGYNNTSSGIIITDGENEITIPQTDGTEKTYTATFPSTFNEKTTLYVKGIYDNALANYFTDLIISKPADLSVTGPTPASQTVQSGETPAAFTVTATGGTGSYTYEWKQDTSAGGSFSTAAEGTVVSDGGTSTFTPTSKSVADNTTYYYKCIVTSGGSNETTGAATLTVTTLTHGYMTIDGTAHAGQTYSFDNNEFKYLVNQSNYNSQNVTITDGQNQKFWELDSSPKWATKDPYTNAADIKAGSNAKFVNLYIKDAVAFKVLALNSASRTYDIYVDGKKVATSQSANPSIESPIFALNKGGSKIEFNNAKEGDSDTDVQIAYIIFYEKAPATINVLKNGEEVTEATQYMGDGATEYEVETNGDGILSLVKPTGATDVTNGYRTTYAEVTLNNGILRVTPLAATPTTPTSTPETITINHTSGTSYADASTTLDVTVKKHTLALAFSYEKASFKASTLTESTVIPSGSLPTLTATVDGEVVDLGTLDIRYKTDDRTIGYFGDTDTPASSRSADGTSYAVKYGGGQGGARIYAYVDNQLNPNYSSAKAYFDFVVEAGTSNAIPKSISIDEQQVFKLANSAGVEVVKLTYGGYKYNHEGGWRNSASRGKYYIDGYQYYTRHGMDALDEYGYQLRGMSDEAQAAPSGSESGDKITVTKKKAKKDGSSSVTFDVYKYSSQNVGAHTFWYTEAETRPDGQHYEPYQRIRPFTLPTRGGYLKFEPKQTGKLTVYVWQNGQMEAKDSSNPDRVGSKPRLGYWFDQNGWVQKPVVAPITKQPITSESFASDVWAGGVRAKMENIWTTTDDIPAINMLTYQYCDNAENPTSYSETMDGGHTALNPYFWKTRAQVRNNLNEETTIISEKMTPAPYHNGYLVPEESYLKYVINVVAGKSYYFYGMMTKIGYVGMNFVQDDNVTISDTGKKFYHQTTPLHLKADDNMETVVANSVQGDANTYLGTVYDEVTLPSNYKKGQWSTICLPFSLTEEQVEEAFGVGTQLTIYNGAIKKSEGIFSVKYLSHVDRNILAGQPYFIKPTGVDANGVDLENVGGVIGSVVEGASGTRITFNTVCIDSNFSTTTTYGSDEDVDKSGSAIGQQGYKFVGAYNNETLPTYSFIVSKGELRRFTGSTSKIPTYYAYLKPNTDAARSGSYSMDVPFTDDTVETAWVIDGGDAPTDVISMEAITDAMNNGRVVTTGKAYNMMGQEIDPTSAKGIVIINGKKYMFE